MSIRVVEINRADGGTSIMQIFDPEVDVSDEVTKWEGDAFNRQNFGVNGGSPLVSYAVLVGATQT